MKEKARISNGKYKYLLLGIIMITSYLFVNNIWGYGLQFDRVFRVNNLISIFNDVYTYDQSIFSINIFGITIPLMYKKYISSMFLIRYIPILMFDDYLFGIRFLEIVYFVFSMGGIYLIISKYDYIVAFIATMLMLSSPMLYPELLFGFTDSFSILIIVLACDMIYNYFSKKDSDVKLFLGIALLFFSINMSFYNVWVVASLGLTSMIFFAKQWKMILTSYRRIFLSVFAMIAGCFNFLLYNINTGFETLRPLYYKLFDSEKYNQMPIDYKEALTLSEDLNWKWNAIKSFFHGYYYIYVSLLIVIIIVYVIFMLNAKRGEMKNNFKIYMFPFANMMIILMEILISPNATRPEHYMRVMPFFEMSLIFSVFILIGNVKKTYKASKIISMIFAILIIANISISSSIIAESNINKGEEYFSPAIFDLKEYINNNDIDSEMVVHLEWGLYSQLYFLNKGNYKINSLVFQLKSSSTNEERSRILEEYISRKPFVGFESLYFPIYDEKDSDIKELFLEFALKNKLSLIEEKKFYEKNGEPVFSLYRLSEHKKIYDYRKKAIIEAEISDDLKILNYGPKVANMDEYEKGIPIWIKSEGHSKTTKIVVNNQIINTVYYEDHLTGLISSEIESDNGKYRIQLYEKDDKIKSAEFFLNEN